MEGAERVWFLQDQCLRDWGALTVWLCRCWDFHCCFLTQPRRCSSVARGDVGGGSLDIEREFCRAFPETGISLWLPNAAFSTPAPRGCAAKLIPKPTPSLVTGCPVECQVCIL